MRKSSESQAEPSGRRLFLAWSQRISRCSTPSGGGHGAARAETAEALLKSVEDHVKAGLAVESDRMSAEVDLAERNQG